MQVQAQSLAPTLEARTMGCLFVMFGAFFPRIAVALIWIARPAVVSQAFGDFFLWPLLGLIFLPFTTLLYLIMWTANGLSGFDFVILLLAVILDVSNLGASAWTNREKVGWRDA
jgi:hypothetical protein